MGDAVLCTPALRAIRDYFQSAKITFLARTVVKDALSPCDFNDDWIITEGKNPITLARKLKQHDFSHAILFKNSFFSALSVFLAKIPIRIGYSREARGIFLTEKLYAPKSSQSKYQPASMVDYYLAVACYLGADPEDKSTFLKVSDKDKADLIEKYPQVNDDRPIVVLVPGAAFGPSKVWIAERFAQVADKLIQDFNAAVFISVAPNEFEKQIAANICNAGNNKFLNIADNPLTLGQLKALIASADLVITNDTGPRHMAVALNRKIVSLFGPNDTAWTDNGYEKEIRIAADVECAPCEKPICKMDTHLCMESITVDAVFDTAKQMLNSPSEE